MANLLQYVSNYTLRVAQCVVSSQIFRVSECSFTNVTGRLIHARVYDQMSSQITVAREATPTEGTRIRGRHPDVNPHAAPDHEQCDNICGKLNIDIRLSSILQS